MAETAPVTKRKKSRPLKTCLIVLLALVLLFAAFAAVSFIYISSSALEYADIPALIAAAPMPVSERWSVRAGAGEADIRIDSSDIYWVIEREGCMAALTEALSRQGCTLEGYVVDIGKDGLVISMGVDYDGKLTVPIYARYALSFDSEYITAAIEELRLGPSVRLSMDKIFAMAGISADELSIRLRRDITPRLQYLSGISAIDGALTLTCSVGTELFDDALSFDAGVRTTYALLTDRDTHNVVSAHNTGDSAAALAEALRKCEAEPQYLSELRCEQLAFAGRAAQKLFFDNKRSPYTERFFHCITEEALAAAEAELNAAAAERITLFTSLAKRLAAARNSGALSFDQGGPTLSGATLDIPSFSGDEWAKYEAWLPAGSLYYYPGINKGDSALILRFSYGQPLCAYWNDKLGVCLFPVVDADDAAFSMPGEIPEYIF